MDWKYIFSGVLKIVPASVAAGIAVAAVYGWHAGHAQWHTPVYSTAGIALGVAAGGLVFIAVSSALGLEEVKNSLKTIMEFNKLHQ